MRGQNVHRRPDEKAREAGAGKKLLLFFWATERFQKRSGRGEEGRVWGEGNQIDSESARETQREREGGKEGSEFVSSPTPDSIHFGSFTQALPRRRPSLLGALALLVGALGRGQWKARLHA